jgi:hypothetical protein
MTGYGEASPAAIRLECGAARSVTQRVRRRDHALRPGLGPGDRRQHGVLPPAHQLRHHEREAFFVFGQLVRSAAERGQVYLPLRIASARV